MGLAVVLKLLSVALVSAAALPLVFLTMTWS